MSQDGTTPKSKLTEGSNGWFYGTTSSGGEFNGGSIYRVHPLNGFEVLYSFNPSTDGSNSQSNMSLWYDNQTFIGATSTGGPGGGGTIFRYHTVNGFASLINLNQNTIGSNITGEPHWKMTIIFMPRVRMVANNGFGTIIGFDINGNIEVKHNFEGGANGSYPQGGMVSMNDWYYGTTRFGGSNSKELFLDIAFSTMFSKSCTT